MTTQVREILASFDRLREDDKREVVTEFLRRSVTTDALPLSDEELVAAADDLFSQLDRDNGDDQ